MVLDSSAHPGKKSQRYVQKHERVTDFAAYFWAKTGPDFMQPMYTRGFDLWRVNVEFLNDK